VRLTTQIVTAENRRHRETSYKPTAMSNPVKDLCIAVEDGNTDRVTELLDQGVPMIMGHFVIATRLKHYGVLETFISRGWDINTEVSGSVPSVLL
jgi:hypothetical protein